MLIRLKQIRAGGTLVTMGKGKEAREYHFKPVDPTKKPNEDHVCDVAHQDDIATFLAIKEGYEVHQSEIASRATPASKPAVLPGAEPEGNDGDPASDKAELIAAVAKKTGKKPHPSTSVAKLQAMLDRQ